MYALIDCTNHQAIATSAEQGALDALAYIQFANIDTVVIPCDNNRPFAQFNSKQLESIYKGVIAKINVPTQFSYTDDIMRCREAIRAAVHLRFPFPADFMQAQAQALKEGDDRPYYISTDKNSPVPVRSKKWCAEPQINRPRKIKAQDPRMQAWLSPVDKPVGEHGMDMATVKRAGKKRTFNQWSDDMYAEDVAAGRPVPPRAPKPPPAPKAEPVLDFATGKKVVPQPPPAKAAKPAKAPPKPASKPKADDSARPTQNGIRRPAPGSKTVVPWDVADKLTAKLGRPATSKEVKEACVKLGCNPNMVGANYSVWRVFHGIKK